MKLTPPSFRAPIYLVVRSFLFAVGCGIVLSVAPAQETAPTETPGHPSAGIFGAAQPSPWSISGQVHSITREGLFITCNGEGDPGLRRRKKGEIIFLLDPYPELGTFRGISAGKRVRYKAFSRGYLPAGIVPGIKQEVRVFELR